MLLERQRVLRLTMNNGISELRTETCRVIHVRQRDLTEQLMELEGLRGKNAGVIKHMKSRIEQEQGDFDMGGARLHAVRSVHLKLLKEVFGLLGAIVLKAEMAQLNEALTQKGLKLGVKKAYGETFARLRSNFAKVQALTNEMYSMLSAMFKQLNTEYGFSLQAMQEPDLTFYLNDFELAQRSHLRYLGLSNVFKLAQPEFADRLVRALSARVRSIHEAALGEVEFWSKSAASQLDAQLRERRRSFVRRMDAVNRIQQAAGGLDERIQDIAQQERELDQLEHKLMELTGHLMAPPKAVAVPLDLEVV
jgi:N-methylhydantoinase A/oxoprolinase/acetone carboxylase beta subunit